MGLLADFQIQRRALKGMIDPYIPHMQGEGIISYGQSSFGYDVRAGYDWKIFTDVLGAIVDPKHQDERAFHTINCLEVADENRGKPVAPVIIPPNSYALTHTLEYIKVPRNVTCVCIGKSTYARCGIHVNVTPLEAGWEGQVTVEISNGTRLPVKVYPGEGIMQVLFFEGEEPDVSYADRKGKYQGQKGITLAQVLEKKKTVDVGAKSILEHEDARIRAELNMRAAEDRAVFDAIDRAMEHNTKPSSGTVPEYGVTFDQFNLLTRLAKDADIHRWLVDAWNGKLGVVDPVLQKHLKKEGLWPPRKSPAKPAVRTRRSR